jgi:hypothetical protein
MTTLAANKMRAYEGAPVRIEENPLPVIASDIIYEGAAVGVVDGTGHGRPLVAGDRFAGFANQKADNAAGAAAAISVDLKTMGYIQLPVTGAVITDRGLAVYASDDDTFSLSPVGGSFIGRVHRFVSAGIVIVKFDVDSMTDPYGEYSVRETLAAATLTLDIEDQGKLIWCTVTTVITLPAVATPTNLKIANGGPFGTVQISLSPNASDKVQGPNLPGTDNKDLINTLATARRGDFARLVTGDANGPFVSELRGIWATEG